MCVWGGDNTFLVPTSVQLSSPFSPLLDFELLLIPPVRQGVQRMLETMVRALASAHSFLGVCVPLSSVFYGGALREAFSHVVAHQSITWS